MPAAPGSHHKKRYVRQRYQGRRIQEEAPSTVTCKDKEHARIGVSGLQE